MAGPLGGIGSYQQVQVSNPYQSGQQNQQVRSNEEQEPRENVVQPREAAAAETQSSESENYNAAREVQTLGQNNEQGAGRRGAILDISV